MKVLMTVGVAAVLSVAVSGCKYSSMNSGAKAGGDGYGNAQGADIAAGIEDAQDGLLDGAGVGERPFEEYCTRCTDVEFAPVYFGFDSTVVPQGEIAKIDEVARHLESNANRVVVVEGNCDERGSNEYNMALGENRSGIIRNYLVQCGIDSSRIQTRSYGEEKPAVDGHDESAWAMNRRGDFAIYQK
jgi:peptidoglycan-associated lipoprotein